MFTLDQDITVPKLREKNLVKLFFSMNNHEVATPEMMLEEARSYVMFYGEADGKVTAYIGLYLILTGRRLFFAHSSNPFPPGEMGSVEDEALCFVEGLGALADQMDIANMSAEEKIGWIDSQDIFSLQAWPEKSPEEPSAQPAEAEAERPEPKASQPPAVVPEAAPAAPQTQPAPQTQSDTQPAPQPVPLVQLSLQTQPAPEAAHLRQASQPDSSLQAAPPAPPSPDSPVDEAPAARVEESTNRPAAPQPIVEPDREYEGHEAPYPADVFETGDAPERQQTSTQSTIQEAPVPAPERTRPKPAARATGSREVLNAASSMGRQDIMRKAIKAGIVKPQKPSGKKEAEDDSSVVRRDREALARLLTSF
jgi:hypothetical protein